MVCLQNIKMKTQPGISTPGEHLAVINFQRRDCCKLLLIFHPLHASDADKISVIIFLPRDWHNFQYSMSCEILSSKIYLQQRKTWKWLFGDANETFVFIEESWLSSRFVFMLQWAFLGALQLLMYENCNRVGFIIVYSALKRIFGGSSINFLILKTSYLVNKCSSKKYFRINTTDLNNK